MVRGWALAAVAWETGLVQIFVGEAASPCRMLPPPPGSQLAVELALAAAAALSPRSELASLLADVDENNRRDPRYAQVQSLKMSSQERQEDQSASSPGREEGQGASSPEREEDPDASMQEGEEEQAAPSPEQEEEEGAPSQGREEEQAAPTSPAASPAADTDFQWYATDFETGKENFLVPKNLVHTKAGREDPQITWEQRARFRSWVTTDRLRQASL